MYRLLSLMALSSSIIPIAADRGLILAPGERLKQGNGITHNNCQLFMQKDGNLVVKKDGKDTWSTKGSTQFQSKDAFFAKLQRGGNFWVKDRGSPNSIFSTQTNGNDLDSVQGGLFFNEDCTISIAVDESKPDVWTNVRSNLYCGNRLKKGEMFKFPPNDPKHTLYLQHDGNLIMFKGADYSDFSGPEDVIWSANVFSDSDTFFLKLNSDGMLVLKEKIDGQTSVYWSKNLAEDNSIGDRGYALTLLPSGGFGYIVTDAECQNKDYTP